MIPWNSNNKTSHPLEARFISELGVDYLIDRYRARLLLIPDDPLYPRFMQKHLAKIDSQESWLRVLKELSKETANDLGLVESSNLHKVINELGKLCRGHESIVKENIIRKWASAWYDHLQEEIKGASYRVEVPLRLQLSHRAKCIIQLLAIARQGMAQLAAPDFRPPLAARLKIRPDSPARGDGKIEIVEVGDLQDPFTAQGHEQILTVLNDLPDYIALRWVHGPLSHHKYSIQAGELTEACAELSPQLFWKVIDQLCRRTKLVRIGAFERALQDLDISPAFIRETLSSGRFRPKVEHDMNLLNATGVPPIRPAFVVDRELFLGADQNHNLGNTLKRWVQSKF